MTRREKTLAYLLLPPLLLLGGGFMVYQLWLDPLAKRDVQIANSRNEIAAKLAAVKKAQEKKKDLEKLQLVSLPKEVELARREYEGELSKLVRTAGFESSTMNITAKKPDTRTSPVVKKGEPIYTKLEFIVQAKGELLSLVEFMEKFYSLPLLHQIRNLKLTRPSTSERNRTYELDITMTIEALVLDKAEPRKVLLSEKEVVAPVELAAEERKYSAIAGKDVFFGPPPKVAESVPTPKKDIDYAEFVKFNGISDGEFGPVLTLYDGYNNNETMITPRSDGTSYRVEVKYTLNGRKRTLRSGKTIDVLDEAGDVQHRWFVLRALERELYLQDEDAYYVLHIGQKLSEMQHLTSEQAIQLGIVAKNTKEPEPPKTEEVPVDQAKPVVEKGKDS